MQCSVLLCGRGRVHRLVCIGQSTSGAFPELLKRCKGAVSVELAVVQLVLVHIRGTGESREEK